MLCKICGEPAIYKGKQLCARCYAKDYAARRPDRNKPWDEDPKELELYWLWVKKKLRLK